MKSYLGVFAAALVACGGSDPTTGTSVEPVASESAPLSFAGPRAAFPELPPTDGLVLWLRSDQGVTLGADGSVSNWHDLTGLGQRDAFPIFGAPGPLYVHDAFNGLPALQGDGTARALFVNGGHGYPMGHASTVFFVMTAPTGGGTAGYIFDGESSQGRQYSIVQRLDGSVEWANATTAAALAGDPSKATDPSVPGDLFKFTCGLPPPGLHIFAETQLDGWDARLNYDGRDVAVFVPKGPSLYLMSLMGGPGNAFQAGNNDPLGLIISTGTFNTDGDLVEVLQYDTEKTPAQVAVIDGYLAHRYGIGAW